MNRRERRAAEAEAKKSKAAPADSSSPTGLCEAGFRHLEAERYLDAQVCCQRALAADPNYGDAMNLMALLSLQSTQYELAAEWASRDHASGQAAILPQSGNRQATAGSA